MSNLRATTMTRPANRLAADVDDWRMKAACAGRAYLFDVEGDAAYQRAKTVCRDCPVREACLAHALKNDEREGVWGGTTPVERARVKRRG